MSGLKDRMLGDAPYPETPGFKSIGASSEAAARIAPRVTGLRADVLAQLDLADLTPDECAARMGRSVLSVRPRFSELAAMELIEKTGQRRENESGMRADVYRRVE